MEDRDIIRRSVDTLTAKPVFIQIDHYPLTLWERLLVKCKLRPVQKVYELRPVLVGNMYRIAAVVTQLPPDILSGNFDFALQQAVKDHLDKIIYIVAVGLQNNRKEPSRALLNRLRHDCDAADLALIIQYVMQQLNLKDFMKSIVLVRGMNILEKTSPMAQEEKIAPGTIPGS